MLAVDLLMRVDRARAGIGVMPGDDVAAAVAGESQTFFEGARGARSFDDDVGALAVRCSARTVSSRSSGVEAFRSST